MTKESIIYKEAIAFLLKDGINSDLIKTYLTSERKKDLNGIFYRLCESAKNRSMHDRVINQYLKSNTLEPLKELLFGFNPKEVAEKYKINKDERKLRDSIADTIGKEEEKEKSERSILYQFAKTIIYSSHYLKSFTDAKDFYKWAEPFTQNDKIKYALPLLISAEIFGIKLALACDFLKEIGFMQYGKPDTHLKEIFTNSGLIDGKENKTSKQDLDILRVIENIAEANPVTLGIPTTPFAVDKIFWLVGSGKYYHTGQQMPDPKSRTGKFIDHIKEKGII